MNLINAVVKDPSTAETTKATTAATAMTAYDTTNLRITFTVPPSGKVFWRISGGALHGAATYPTMLIGILESTTVVARAMAKQDVSNLAATQGASVEAYGVITGLTPGASKTYDVAYAVQTGVASTAWKCGGPNTNAGNNAWGGIVFELWDPQPITSGAQLAVDTSGRVDVGKVTGTAQTAGDLKASLNTLQADTDDIQTRLPAALVSGRMDASVGAMASNVITAAAINAGALNGKGDWNIGKTGYSLTQTFPSNFSSLSITAAGLVDITQTAADKVWGTTTRRLSDGTNIVLAKGTGITGFNDLDAAGVRTAVGLASANLDTQLTTIDDFLDTEIADIRNRLPAALVSGRMDCSVGSMANNTLTAAAINAGALNGKGDWLLSSGYTAPPSAAAIRAEIDSNSVGLAAIFARTDVATSTRLAASSYTTPPTEAAIADTMLGRNLAGGADGGRTVADAMRALRNKTSLAAGVLTVYAEDDTTPAWTAAVTQAARDPITAVDPA